MLFACNHRLSAEGSVTFSLPLDGLSAEKKNHYFWGNHGLKPKTPIHSVTLSPTRNLGLISGLATVNPRAGYALKRSIKSLNKMEEKAEEFRLSLHLEFLKNSFFLGCSCLYWIVHYSLILIS